MFKANSRLYISSSINIPDGILKECKTPLPHTFLYNHKTLITLKSRFPQETDDTLKQDNFRNVYWKVVGTEKLQGTTNLQETARNY